MNELLPIIRRVRRPLMVEPEPAPVAGPVQPVAAQPLVAPVPAAPAPAKTKSSDGKNVSQPEAG